MSGLIFPATKNVPTIDSADNLTRCDVVGNKDDSHSGNSLYANLKTVLEHIHSASKIYPSLANGVSVTAGAAWTLGSFVEIVPLSAITNDFDIHYVSIEDISANDVYELVLYSDADGTPGSEVEIGRVRFVRSAVQSATLNAPMRTPLIAANSQIKAKIASSGGGNNATISIFYHIY